MRRSADQYDDQGNLFNGFDYVLQVWVKAGIIQNCGHPESMRPGCCNADRLHGQEIKKFKGGNLNFKSNPKTNLPLRLWTENKAKGEKEET